VTSDPAAVSAPEVDQAILRLLPGGVTSVRPSDQGASAGVVVFRVGPETTAYVSGDADGWFASLTEPDIPRDDAPRSDGVIRQAPGGGSSQLAGEAATASVIAEAFVNYLRDLAGDANTAFFDSGLLDALRRYSRDDSTAKPDARAPGGEAVLAGAAAAATSGAAVSAGVPSPGVLVPPFATPIGRFGPPPSYLAQALAPRRTSFTRKAIVIAAIIVVSLLVLGFGAAGVVAVISASTKSGQSTAIGSTPAATLAVGQCFNVGKAQQSSDNVDPVPCSHNHDSELFAIETIPENDDSSGRVAYDLADIACFPHFHSYVGSTYGDSNDDYGVLVPSDAAWNAGDRKAYCYLTFTNDRTGSARGSGE